MLTYAVEFFFVWHTECYGYCPNANQNTLTRPADEPDVPTSNDIAVSSKLRSWQLSIAAFSALCVVCPRKANAA